jgi:hypothetical protein
MWVRLLGSGLPTKERWNTSLGNDNNIRVPVISLRLTGSILLTPLAKAVLQDL